MELQDCGSRIVESEPGVWMIGKESGVCTIVKFEKTETTSAQWAFRSVQHAGRENSSYGG